MPDYVILDEDTLVWQIQITGTITDTIFYNSSATFDKGSWQLGKANFLAGVTPLSCRLRYLDVNTGSGASLGGIVAGDVRTWEATFYSFGSLVHTATSATTETRPSGATFTLDDLRRIFTVPITSTYITVSIPAQLVQWIDETETSLSELYGHSPPYSEKSLAWLPKTGQTATIAIEGVIAYTYSETITGAGWAGVTLDEIPDMIIEGQDETTGGDISLGARQCTADFSLIPKYNTNSVYSVSPTYTHVAQGYDSLSNSIGTATATVDGTVRLEMVAPNPAAISGGAYGYQGKCHGYVTASIMPRKTYTIDGKLYAMNVAYPESLDVIVQETYPDNTIARSTTYAVSSGSFSHTATQDYWTIASSLQYHANSVASGQTKTDSDTIDERASISARVTAGSLSARGENASDIRMLFRGLHYDVFELGQEFAAVVSSSFSDTAASNRITRTISALNGCEGTLRGADWLNPCIAGWRLGYAELTASGQTGNAYQVEIGGKTWSKDYTGSPLVIGSNQSFDLCNPDGSSTVDTTDTRYPLSISGGKFTKSDSALFGVSDCSEVIFKSLVNGVSYTVVQLGVVSNAIAVSVMQAFGSWVQQNTGSAEEWRNGFLWVNTDERKSAEFGDGKRELVSGSYAYTPWTIKTLMDKLSGAGGNLSSGFNVTALEPDPGSYGSSRIPLSYYAHDGRYAAFLCASGATKRAGVWKVWLDEDMTSFATLPAQVLFDELMTFPRYCGDIDGLTGTANASFDSHKMAVCWIGRGRAEGIVHNTSNSILSAVVVDIQAGTDGTGTSDTQGIYRTGTPYVNGSDTQTVRAISGTNPSASVTFPPRKAMRVSFRVGAVTSCNPFNLHDASGQFYRVVVCEGAVTLNRSVFTSPVPSWELVGVAVTTETDCFRPTLYIDTRGRLYCVYESGGNALYRVSDDDGNTWGGATTVITGGTKPFGACDEFGNELIGAVVASGSDYVLKGRYRAAGDSAFGSTYTFQYDNSGTLADLLVENDTFSLSNAPDMQSRWLLSCLPDGDTETREFESFDDGATWRLIS